VRMLVRGLRVPMGLFTVLVGRGGVLLGFIMLADGMVVCRLVVMMGCSTVASGCLMMVVDGGMLALFGHRRSPR
jgi:hypothetical protein